MKIDLSRFSTSIRYLAVIPVVVLGLLSILASGGGGGGGSSGGTTVTGPTVAELAGTWSGTIEGTLGDRHTISVTIDGSGNITQQLIDGVDSGITGTIQKTSGTIFSYVLSTATIGKFIVDASVTHAGFVNQLFEFGVVEKGAGSLPTYVSADAIGNWSGFGMNLDNTFNVVQTATSNAIVAPDYSYTATDSLGGTTLGQFTTFDATYGVSAGSFITFAGAAGTVEAFLSTDKTFAASWTCDTTDGSVLVGFPADCSFFTYNRQGTPPPPEVNIAISPTALNLDLSDTAGTACAPGSTSAIFPVIVSTSDDLGFPLGNTDITLELDLGGAPVASLLDSMGTELINSGSPIPYQTQTENDGTARFQLQLDTSLGCSYSGSLTVTSGTVSAQMQITAIGN